MKEAVSGGSDVATTGVTKVGGSTQFTSLAVPDTFKPSAPSAVAPSTAPTAFVGPIPATATRTDTGYTTSSGTTVTPTPAPKPAPTPAISNQFSNLSNNATSTATMSSPATNLSGKVDTVSSKVDPKELAKSAGTTAADLAFGTSSFKAGARAFGAAITGKDAQGKPVNRVKSAASGFGNTALGAVNLASTASLLFPGGGEFIKGGDVALNAAVKGSKLLKEGTAVSPKVSKAVISAVKDKSAQIEAKAAAANAKVVSKGDLALTEAMKKAQLVKTHATGKVASGIAAGAIALGPGAAGASSAGKAATAITQSLNAAKKSTAALESFAPKAAKASAKVTSGGAIPDVIKPALAAPGVKAGTSSKIAQTITAANAVPKAATAVNNMFNNDGTKTTIDSTKDNAATTKTNSQSQNTTNTSRTTNFNTEVSNHGGGKGKTTFKGTDPNEFKDPTNKNQDTINKKNNTNKNIPDKTPEKPYHAREIIVDYGQNQNQNTEGGKGEGGGGGKKPPKEEPPKKPRRIPHIKLQGDGRQWRPSSIV